VSLRDLLPIEPFGFRLAAAATRLDGEYPLAGNGTGANLRAALGSFRGSRLIGFGPCKSPRCSNTRYGVWCKTIRSNGTEVASLRCLRCGWEIRAASMKKISVALPVYADHRTEAHCEKCGESGGVELHHWAPRHLFGWEEADEWPTSLLCPPCHRRWHSLVTPNMGQRKAS
jgi:hypothetical protein